MHVATMKPADCLPLLFSAIFSPKRTSFVLSGETGACFVFIFLDTGEDKPDSDIEYSGITDYDRYRTEQAQWLAQAVQSDDFKQAKYKIVIAHMPPLPDKNLWHGQMEVLEKFVPILNQAGVDVMLRDIYIVILTTNRPIR